MELDRVYLDLLIPLTAEDKAVNEILDNGAGNGTFAKIFSWDGPRSTERLKGSPLLNVRCPAGSCRYRLGDGFRSKLGLGNGPKCRYTLVKTGTEFIIDRICVVFFRLGGPFLRLSLLLGMNGIINGEDTADFVNQITKCTSGNSIVYNSTTYERSFTIESLIRSFCDLQDEVKLGFDGTSHAFGLLYGFGRVKEGELPELTLDVLRQQHKSVVGTASVSQKHFFNRFEGITWATGKRMVVCFGSQDSRNVKFITDPGGLKSTIFENYEAVYLYMLAVDRYLSKCSDAFEKAKSSSKDNRLRSAALDLMRRCDDLPLKGLTDMEHINDLFEDYVSRDVLSLPERIEKVNRKYLPELLKTSNFDVFISYRREGGFYPARLIYEILTAQHRKVFLDVERLGSGRFDDHIREVISQCAVMVVVYTKGCLASVEEGGSDWMRREVKAAQSEQEYRDMRIIPVYIDCDHIPSDLPYDPDISSEQSVLMSPQTFRGAIAELARLLDSR